MEAASSAVAYVSTSQLRARHVPDVPEDIMDHFNDPNYDLRRSSMSTTWSDVFELESKRNSLDQKRMSTLEFKSSEYDTESQADYTSNGRSGSRASAIDFDDESPYPEVRAAVSSIDDPKIPVNTFRLWFLGLFFSTAVASFNQVFNFRYPSVYVTAIVVQLISLPFGKGLARILPTTRFRTAGYTWSFNPGPFSVKEHVVITVMANVSVYGAYVTDLIASQKIFYGQVTPISYQILLALSTQILGFSLAGVLRQFLVWPSSMIWPGALVSCALFNTLHKNYNRKETKHISRQRFFLIVLLCSFVWYWVPGLLWTGLSVFNWVCWIAPNNVLVNQVFGTLTGLGIAGFSLDWSAIAYISSPLVTPWWSEANTAAALVIMFWIVAPALYYSNTWYFKFLPISSGGAFDNTGLPYDIKAIFTNGAFDVEKYRAYSPTFLTPTQALCYGIAFASLTAVVVHTFLWYRHDIIRRFRTSLKDERDVHARLMQAYPETPYWWFAVLFGVTLLFLLIAIHLYPTQMPIWGVIVAILFSSSLALPAGMTQAITNQPIYLNVIGELLGGYILPNKPVANMIFKAVTLLTSSQAILFAGNLKLGHYMKIPPRVMFASQILAVTVNCFVVIGVQNFMFSNVVDLCAPDQKQGFTCPPTHAFATSSLIWGGIGPQRLFSPGAMYNGLLYFFLAGALAPIPFYFLAFRYPLSFWRYVNMPVFFAGVSNIPPATGANYSAWVITGFVFQYLMRRFHFRWWMRYNYILSAGLDAGVALGLIAIFFFVQLPSKNGVNISWWGNNVWLNTADANGTALFTLQPNQTFGPPAGSWR